MQTQRAPVINEQKVPEITDNLNTDVQNFAESQISMNINSTFCQEEKEDEEQQKNCYLILPWEDIKIVVESINDDNEQMRIYFGCKALKSILLVSSQELTKKLLQRHSKRLLKRLVIVLGYEHLPDAMVEALHIVVLLTNMMDYDVISEMVVSGLVHQLNKFIDVKFLQSRSNKLSAELALQIMANITQISNLSIQHVQ